MRDSAVPQRYVDSMLRCDGLVGVGNDPIADLMVSAKGEVRGGSSPAPQSGRGASCGK